MIGKTISHYKILERLGGGGMGVVYKAKDLVLERNVAIKFLPQSFNMNESSKQRFIHEAKSASSLQHNNICKIHEINETKDLDNVSSGQMYICMEYYEGETLKSKIENGPLPFNEAFEIIIQIARGLEKAHEKGIVHRDIKSANIFITNDGVVKILDFGLAKTQDQTQITQLGSTMGTVSYMSPEQTHGRIVDHRSDIWSLGIVMYEMIRGHLPFAGEMEQAVIYLILNEDPEITFNGDDFIPLNMENIVKKCIEKEPSERYQTISELLAEFKNFTKEFSITFDESIPQLLQRVWRKKIVQRLTAVITLLTLVFTALFIFQPSAVEPTSIAVISFENQTGEASYDILSKSIPNLLITTLEQSGQFRVVTWERLNDLKKQIGKDSIEFIDSELGIQLCSMEGIPNIIVGSIAKIGDIFATDLKILDVETKEILQTAQSRGDGDSSIFRQIDELGIKLTAELGEIEEENIDLQRSIVDITTNSMNAYNYYIIGRDEYSKMYYDDARKSLEKAVRLDSTFAIAHLTLYLANIMMGYRNTAIRHLEKAKRNEHKVTENEKLRINARYAQIIEKDNEKRINILEEIVLKYPKEIGAHLDLGKNYQRNEEYEKAIEEFLYVLKLNPYNETAINRLAFNYAEIGEFNKALEYLERYKTVAPGDANPYDSIGELYHYYLGNLDKAIANYKRAIEIKPDFHSRNKIVEAYSLQGNYIKALKWLDNHIPYAPSELYTALSYWKKAFLYYWLNNKTEARNALEEVVEYAQKIENNEWREEVLGEAGILNLWINLDDDNLRSNHKEMKKYFKRRKKLLNHMDKIGADSDFLLASNLSMVHLKEYEIDSARHLITDMKSLLPHVRPGVNDQYKKMLGLHYVNVLANEDSIRKAIAEFKKLISIKTGIWWPENFPWSFIQDGIAKGYIKKGDLKNAISEYERLTKFDHNNRFLIKPEYFYELARLYEQEGMNKQAAENYAIFIEYRKSADRILPDLLDAKRRLALIQN